MGKTKDPITQFIFDSVEEMKPLFDGLDETDQNQMHNIFKHLTKYKIAIKNAKLLRPIEAICILMLLVVYKWNKKLHHAQYEEIRRLRRALEAAGQIAEIEPIPIEEDDAEEEVDLLKMLVEQQADALPKLT